MFEKVKRLSTEFKIRKQLEVITEIYNKRDLINIRFLQGYGLSLPDGRKGITFVIGKYTITMESEPRTSPRQEVHTVSFRSFTDRPENIHVYVQNEGKFAFWTQDMLVLRDVLETLDAFIFVYQKAMNDQTERIHDLGRVKDMRYEQRAETAYEIHRHNIIQDKLSRRKTGGNIQ